jgi:Tfp pilus assembly protein PilX
MTKRARFASEDGMTLIISLAVLVIVGLLAGLVITTAAGTNRITRDDTNEGAALAAANAGLAVAAYRLNMLGPDSAHCVTTVVNLPTSALCPIDGPETLGNGSSFEFQVTPALTTGGCAGQTVTNATTPVTDRCVTSIGTANGATARSQARIDAWAASPIFPYAGITGLNGIAISNNAQVNGALASNGKITISNNATVGAIALGGGTGTLSTSNGVTTGAVTDVGRIGAAAVPVGNAPTVNSNARITSGQDASSGGVTYTALTRTLTVSNNASLTLGGTVYDFCNLTMANNASLTIAATVQTEIIIDSPDDPNSGGCPAGSGKLQIGNNSIVTTLSGKATALQIYVYGTNDGKNVVDFSNNGATFATIFAPQSTVNLSNNGAFTGAVLGLQVNELNNFTFNYGSDATSLSATSQGMYYRSAWVQCPSAPTSSGDLSSGC